MSFQNPVFIPGPPTFPKTCAGHVTCRRSITARRFSEHPAPARDRAPDPALHLAEIFIFPPPGTGGWETAITNTLSARRHGSRCAQRHVLHRWIDMCQRHGLTVEVVETPGARAFPPIASLRSCAPTKPTRSRRCSPPTTRPRPACVSNIAAVRKALDDAGHPALLLVDGVSSIASMDFEL
jgi:alanine-glyoxylate transaminase/serine-glyoxylate transaminase/serine-pyruvate transaminase